MENFLPSDPRIDTFTAATLHRLLCHYGGRYVSIPEIEQDIDFYREVLRWDIGNYRLRRDHPAAYARMIESCVKSQL